MGFRKPDLTPAYDAIRKCGYEVLSWHNDGYIQKDCKHNLFKLKCYLEDMYSTLPDFEGEDEWEQERLVEILKRK
jgi:hypothetical protein